ncbi:Putative flavin reductase like domain, FMN-binding split barrel [Colletotrichum destructivum]|uniref:Flavin reductase like domain, FMN-binding split barrel n=1 Tax=Colletotrichum destructivum TaxID=34406 RepID=A0AAX4J2V5_9PEZI|nr:Putative flavin reductase like domain, FMN-binding split barrel [Colletotrichum destructivum]
MSGACMLATAVRRAGRARTGVEGARRTLVGGFPAESQQCPQWSIGHNSPRTSEPRRAIHNTSVAPRSSTWRTKPSQPPTSIHNSKDELPEQLRGVMRRLAHSVVVCTATDRRGQPRGMTMSSFVSLSMEPVPLVTFNVRTPSRTLQAIEDEGGLFNVHVLAEGAEGARVAEWFTRGNAAGEGLFRELPDGVEVCEEDGEAPVLEGRGVLYVLKCKVLGEGMVRVRDHVVIVGEVEEVVRGEGEGFGLVYADRRYRTLGEVLVKGEE